MWGDIKKLVLVACIGLVAVGLLVAIVNPVIGPGVCTAMAPWGWVVSVLSAGIIVGLAWTLLVPAAGGPDGGNEHHAIPCPACARAVLTDWRLCPYCGATLSRATMGDEPQHG